MGSDRNNRTAGRCCAAVLCSLVFDACSPGHRAAIEGVQIFDAEVALVRGDKIDSAQREFSVDGNATFVAMVVEDDTDVKVVLSHGGAQGIDAARIEIDSSLFGEGIEIAVLEAPLGSRVTLSLESLQDFDRPGKARLKVMRYDAEFAREPRVAARLAAFHAWSAATGAQLTGEDFRKTAIRDIDLALRHLEAVDGDVELAAWGRMVRSRLNYRQFANLKVSLADARRAERGFAALGAARNAARAQLLEAVTLIEIANDKTAKDPGNAEAAEEARRLLTALGNEPALSDLERARSVNYLGVLAYHLYDLPEARVRFLAATRAFEAMGNRQGRLMVLGNLGAIAYDAGDYRAATQYYDQLIAELDRVGSITVQTSLLLNAARIDINAGNVDRAIERLLRALVLARKHKMQQHEARALHGLGHAYWDRGDTAQATALLGEALELRRTGDDTIGLMESLGANGILAREAGDIQKALALHRERVSLATTPDFRVLALLDVALDYQATADYQRAIATCREALSIRFGIAEFHKRNRVQLALADMLIAQPHRTPQAVSEAATLAQNALGAAIRRADTTLEIAARQLLARSHAARRAFGEARAEYERAIALIFEYRSTIHNPELRAVTLAHEQQTFRGYVDLLMRDVAQRGPGKPLPVSNAEEDALRTLEWARAINLDSARVSQLDAATQARVDDLLARMAGKRVRIAALLDRTEDVTRELEVLQLDIAQLRAEVDQLRTKAAQHAKVADVFPTVDAPWPKLRAGTTQLSYVLETEHAYLWVRDATGIRATVLAAGPAAIARDVESLAGAIRRRAPQQFDAILARLSTVLLPAGVLGSDSSTLEIVAEGRIASVPFAALSSPSEPVRRLAERQTLVMIGSLFDARVRPQPTQPRPLRFVALANDVRSNTEAPAAQVFPPLQRVNAEARAIAALFERRAPPAQVRLLRGAEGSARNLKKAWREGADVIHFATHGLADLRQPLASLLLLPALDAAGSPTYLTAGQVQEWRGDADLVFLSACETAVGPARFAEGLPGLQRAFLRAGARGVIATLWPVEDVYASQFATDFYRRYIASTTASQALSETQRAWLQSVPGIREDEQAHRRMTAWAHVFYAQ